MKRFIANLVLSLAVLSSSVHGLESKALKFDSADNTKLTDKKWFGGAENCDATKTEPFDIYSLNDTTWILRQSKCDTWEAPFMYLLVGDKKALLLDTGAIDNANESPLASTIEKILAHMERPNLPLIILHSHSHSDHVKGDKQFEARKGTTVIKAKVRALKAYLDITRLGENGATINLGNRPVTVLATPGHHDESITLYDAKDKLLLTGDTLYPGLIMVKSWKDYQASIALLADFTVKNPVDFILGGHIEMSSTPGVYYPIGSEYQPNEHALVLTSKHLHELRSKIKDSEKQSLTFDAFEISPMSGLQKAVSGILGSIFGD